MNEFRNKVIRTNNVSEIFFPGTFLCVLLQEVIYFMSGDIAVIAKKAGTKINNGHIIE